MVIIKPALYIFHFISTFTFIMKRLLLFVLGLSCLYLVFLTSSCKTVWDEDDKQVFIRACLDDANKWSGSEAKSKTYCDCVMEKIQKKYPRESDALDHVDSLVNDPEIRQCKSAANSGQ